MFRMDVRLLVGPKVGQLRGGDVVLYLMRPGFHKVVGMEVRFIKVVLRGKKTRIGPTAPISLSKNQMRRHKSAWGRLGSVQYASPRRRPLITVKLSMAKEKGGRACCKKMKSAYNSALRMVCQCPGKGPYREWNFGSLFGV